MANKPVHKFQAGQVSVALWENTMTTKNGDEVPVLKATLQRRYKDKEGNWQTSTSFSRNELPLAIYCLSKAFQKIIEDQSNSSGEVEEEMVM